MKSTRTPSPAGAAATRTFEKTPAGDHGRRLSRASPKSNGFPTPIANASDFTVTFAPCSSTMRISLMRRPSNVVSSKLAAWLIPGRPKLSSRYANATQIRGDTFEIDVFHGNLMRQRLRRQVSTAPLPAGLEKALSSHFGHGRNCESRRAREIFAADSF